MLELFTIILIDSSIYFGDLWGGIGMYTRLMIVLVVLFILFEGFMVYLLFKYKQGKIEKNPLLMLPKKESKFIYYAFFKWKLKNQASNERTTFSLNMNTNYFWFYIALLHEQIIEMVIFHFYFKSVEPSLAYIISALHIYSILYIIGDYNWVRNTPICVKERDIHIKVGGRREIFFTVDDIQLIQPAKLKINNHGGIIHEKDVFHATAFPRALTRTFGISDELKHEIIFNKPIYYTSYFGVKKQANTVFSYIEDSGQLVNLLEEKLKNIQANKQHVDLI